MSSKRIVHLPFDRGHTFDQREMNNKDETNCDIRVHNNTRLTGVAVALQYLRLVRWDVDCWTQQVVERISALPATPAHWLLTRRERPISLTCLIWTQDRRDFKTSSCQLWCAYNGKCYVITCWFSFRQLCHITFLPGDTLLYSINIKHLLIELTSRSSSESTRCQPQPPSVRHFKRLKSKM